MKNYLEWMASETGTTWWNDSAVPSEIDEAIASGAIGVTTNPVLTYKAITAQPELWADEIDKIPMSLRPEERAEEILKLVAVAAAKKFEHIYAETNGQHGYALGQLNPAICHNTDMMLAQALRYCSWADNIAVKLPTVKSALPVIEELAARGIAVCTTLNFSVSQGLAAGEAYERGVLRAVRAGIPVKPCFVVQQGGRLDEYLSEVVSDNGANIAPGDIENAGNAVCKKLYTLFKERGISAKIMPAGLRTVKHLTDMVGSDMVFSLQPRVQQMVVEADPPRELKIDDPIPEDSINRLRQVKEFERAYQEGGMEQDDFITFGVTQKTLSQFFWTGWFPLETYGTDGKSQRWY